MQQRKKTKLSEQTADGLYEMIAQQGKYPAGTKLPNENELSQHLGVSRTTLREAISFLVAQGVLEIRRGLGTFVREDLPDHTLDLSTLQSLHAKDRARELYEMRMIFEPAAVAMACHRATDDELAMLQCKALLVEATAAEGGDWAAADQEFHQSIIKVAHNEYLRRLYPIINDAVSEIMVMLRNRGQGEVQQVALADNRLILEFLMQRDAQAAHQAMSIHMRHLLTTVGDW